MKFWLAVLFGVPLAAFLAWAAYIETARWLERRRWARYARQRLKDETARLNRGSRDLEDAVRHDAARHPHDDTKE